MKWVEHYEEMKFKPHTKDCPICAGISLKEIGYLLSLIPKKYLLAPLEQVDTATPDHKIPSLTENGELKKIDSVQ